MAKRAQRIRLEEEWEGGKDGTRAANGQEEALVKGNPLRE